MTEQQLAVLHQVLDALGSALSKLDAPYVESICEDAQIALRSLLNEHAEDQGVIAVWRGRTLRAEQQRDELLAALKLAWPQLIGHAERTARAAIDRVEKT
jgi:hypothetical protein